MLGTLAGCVLDFEQFRTPGGARDVVPVTDAGFDAGFDAGLPPDAGTAAPDVPVIDVAPPVDRINPQCVPPPNASIRVAHMAVGHGAVDLCMRRNNGAPYAPVISNDWPDQGVGYGMVSQHVALNLPVTAPNDRWQFALVPRGADCTAAGGDAGVAIATHSVTIDPQSESTLLFTAEVTNDGRLLGLLGLLNDQPCTTCPSNTIDVRAIHAAFGASAERVDFSINYSLPPSYPAPFVNVFFATNVSYGQTAPVGGAGFDCDPDWRVAAGLPLAYSVQFAALNVSSDILARSDRVALKTELLLRSRMATLFFLGGNAAHPAPPEFVLCYEGARNAGMTVCDRIPGTPEARPAIVDAGASTLVRDAATGADDDVLL